MNDKQMAERAEELLKELCELSGGDIAPYYGFDSQGRHAYIFTLDDMEGLRELLSNMTLH